MVSTQEKVSNCKTTVPQARPRIQGFLSARLHEKGWSVRNAADYLGVSRQRLYSVFSDPRRVRLWECAVSGLPACTPELAATIKADRAKKPKPLVKPKIMAPGLEVDDIVIADKYAGIAEEGDEGWIAAIRGNKAAVELLVKMPGGEDWFPLADFHALFVTTGQTRKEGSQYARH